MGLKMLKSFFFFLFYLIYKIIDSSRNKGFSNISEIFFRALLMGFVFFLLECSGLFSSESGGIFLDNKSDYQFININSDYYDYLLQKEREMLFKGAETSIRLMYKELELASKSASRIGNISLQRAVKTAIQAALAALVTSNSKEQVIAAALAIIADHANDAYASFVEARKHLEKAQHYAEESDFFQERLWAMN